MKTGVVGVQNLGLRTSLYIPQISGSTKTENGMGRARSTDGSSNNYTRSLRPQTWSKDSTWNT